MSASGPAVASEASAARERRAAGRRLWLKVVLGSAATLLLLAGLGVFTYQMALARIPQHRAALERLVRARTGLDVRFNELGVRWGWYGPEAVFREVELGEPGRSRVLLRASALIVDFDAWRSLESGELQAGRVTLVSPDIDVERLRPRAGPPSVGAAAPQGPSDWLARVPNGRVDVQGGTFSVPDPRSPDHALVLQLRSATLRRADGSWSATAFALLPERLGRSLHLTLELTAPPQKPARLTGALRLEGAELLFSSWRELLEPVASWARELPSAGSGSLSLALSLHEGRVSGASGEIRAAGVALELAPLGPVALPGTPLKVGDLQGTFTLARLGDGAWHLTASRLGFGPHGRDMPPTTVSLDLGPEADWARAQLAAAPLEALRPAIAWLVPEWDMQEDPTVQGEARELSLDWQAARPPGARLRLALNVAGLKLAGGPGLALEGATARVSGTESQLLCELEGTAAQLTLARAAPPLAGLKLAARLELMRTPRGWRLAAPRLLLEHARGMLLASGALDLRPGELPALVLRASLADGDAGALRAALGEPAPAWLGPVLANLTQGRITRAELNVHGRLGVVPTSARALNGYLALEDGALRAVDRWPALSGLSGRLEMRGRTLRANVTAAASDSLRLTALAAQWSASGVPSLHASGQAHGDLSDVLAWLNAHTELAGLTPALQDIQAHGPAQFSFSVLAPAAAARSAPRVHLSARLDGVSVRLAPALPPLESVRGTLSFDGQRLQRSQLEALWLGGATQVRLAERRAPDPAGISVQLQGTLAARELLAASGLDAGMLDVRGQTPWKAELTVSAATAQRPLSVRAHAESSLAGIASALPAPLAKTDTMSLPLRLDAEATGDAGVLRVALGDLGRGVFQLRVSREGTYEFLRGAVRFGGAAVQLPDAAALELQGTLARLDLPAWLAAWRTLQRGSGAPPLEAMLTVNALSFGTDEYGGATLELHRQGPADVLRIDAEEVAGTVSFPRAPEAPAPGEAHFQRVRLPAADSAGAWLAALAPAMHLTVENLTFEGRSLGALSAQLTADSGRIALADLRLAGTSYAAHGSLECAAAVRPCRLEFALDSSDSAATLRAFGLPTGLSAERASLAGTLQWPALAVRETRSFLASATGQVSLALTDGALESAAAGDARVLPLFGLPQLRSGPGVAPGARTAGLKFTRLTGEFRLASGNALTSNLHLDGDAEILLTGRIGLLAQDYDGRAVILSGTERLPDAVRHLSASASPHVAAAWLALRDLVGSREADSSRLQLHIAGSWERPRLELVH